MAVASTFFQFFSVMSFESSIWIQRNRHPSDTEATCDKCCCRQHVYHFVPATSGVTSAASSTVVGSIVVCKEHVLRSRREEVFRTLRFWRKSTLIESRSGTI